VAAHEALMTLRRVMSLSGLLLLAMLLAVASGAGASASRPAPSIAAGTYRGALKCTGSDSFSNGAATRRYRSSPAASVAFASGHRLRQWTYVFLGRRDLLVQSHAVRRGQSFSYAAGTHIGKPGRTRVTVDDVASAPGAVNLLARLDWASPATHYVGAGTYALTLTRVSGSTIRYEAVKVVVKQPLGATSKANPVVRRHEHCVGLLSR
jgi:hypothetical protein